MKLSSSLFLPFTGENVDFERAPFTRVRTNTNGTHTEMAHTQKHCTKIKYQQKQQSKIMSRLPQNFAYNIQKPRSRQKRVTKEDKRKYTKYRNRNICWAQTRIFEFQSKNNTLEKIGLFSVDTHKNNKSFPHS